VWLGIITMSLLLIIGIILLLLWRWWHPFSLNAPQVAQHGRQFDPTQTEPNYSWMRPITAVDIAALERELPSCRPQVIGQSHRAAGGVTCSICLADFEDGEEGRTLPCEHLFHVPCIDGWLAQHLQCPLCRHLLPALQALAPTASPPTAPTPSPFAAPPATSPPAGVTTNSYMAVAAPTAVAATTTGGAPAAATSGPAPEILSRASNLASQDLGLVTGPELVLETAV